MAKEYLASAILFLITRVLLLLDETDGVDLDRESFQFRKAAVIRAFFLSPPHCCALLVNAVASALLIIEIGNARLVLYIDNESQNSLVKSSDFILLFLHKK